MTPEGAKLTSHTLRVNSARAIRKLDYVKTLLLTLRSDTLSWMRQEGMIAR